MRVSSRKNIYLKPVRRLLQFLHALAFYFRYKRWPARAPTPEDTGRNPLSAWLAELADESLISNYFDGSTKLTLDLAGKSWWQLMDHFMPMRVNSKRPIRRSPDHAGIAVADLVVQDKGRSFNARHEELRCPCATKRSREALQIQLMEGRGPTQAGRWGEPIQWLRMVAQSVLSGVVSETRTFQSSDGRSLRASASMRRGWDLLVAVVIVVLVGLMEHVFTWVRDDRVIWPLGNRFLHPPDVRASGHTTAVPIGDCPRTRADSCRDGEGLRTGA